MAVSDPQAAAQWYLDHIGGENVDGRAERLLLGTTRFIWRQADDRRPSEGSVIDHFGFSVADLDAKLRDLEAAGATITTPRREVEGLFPLSFVEDPWGVRLELIEDPQHLGFHHVHLRSPEPETALQWYSDKFGGVRTPLRGRLDGILVVSLLEATWRSPEHSRSSLNRSDSSWSGGSPGRRPASPTCS